MQTHQLRNTIHNIGLVWKVLERGPLIPVIITEDLTRSSVSDRRPVSPLKSEAWSSVNGESVIFRIE